jgi:hypothetical protein
MPPDERRFWYCGGKTGIGHVVGELVYVKLMHHCGGQTALMQYEQSLDAPPDDSPPARNDAIVGTVKGMHCTLCSNTFDWYAGEAAMERLKERIGGRNE